MQDMPTIAELEQRIIAALDRIGHGLDRLPAANAPSAPAGDDATALQEALETERGAVAQLAERLRTVKEREAKARADLEARLAELTEARDQQGLELQRLRKTVAQLRDTLTAQNEAIRAGVTEPQVINKSLLAELEALRVQRRSESAEMEAILSALAPLIEEPAHHA
jgi:predicted  nucleic acid-binding Zn-ribbon protein